MAEQDYEDVYVRVWGRYPVAVPGERYSVWMNAMAHPGSYEILASYVGPGMSRSEPLGEKELVKIWGGGSIVSLKIAEMNPLPDYVRGLYTISVKIRDIETAKIVGVSSFSLRCAGYEEAARILADAWDERKRAEPIHAELDGRNFFAMTSTEIVEEVLSKYPKASVKVLDNKTMAPSRLFVEWVLGQAWTNLDKYTAEDYDCDDFTDRLLGWLSTIPCAWARIYGQRPDGSGGHAMCGAVTCDEGLILIEPQTCTIVQKIGWDAYRVVV